MQMDAASDDDDSDEFAPVYDDQFDGSSKQWRDHAAELEPLDDPRTPDVVDDLASRLIPVVWDKEDAAIFDLAKQLTRDDAFSTARQFAVGVRYYGRRVLVGECVTYDLAWLAKLDGLRRVFAWRFARPLDEDQLVRADRLVRGGDAASALDGETLARACRTAHALLEPEAVAADAVVAVGHLVQVAGFRMLSPEGRAKLVRARAVDKIQRVARRHLRRAAH